MTVLARNNVVVSGRGARTILFSHGFGCDQAAWKRVAPSFEDDFRVVLFDHVGAGGSDLTAYDPRRYDRLHGYAEDLLQIIAELEAEPVLFVGHSVGAMIGMLAAIEAPHRFASLVMLCPSACYIDGPGYVGGFSPGDIDELLEVVDSNFLGWSRTMTPAIMGNPDRPQLAAELGNSFCRTDPAIARAFARVTFRSDHRSDLALCATRSLVLQTRADMIAPESVGAYIADQMPAADLLVMQATGHCPHMSAPEETIAAIRTFVAD